MNIMLFNKESAVTTSSVFVAYQIIKFFEKNKTNKLSMFKLINLVKAINLEASPKQLMFGLIFLHASGVIEIDGSFIIIRGDDV